MAVKTQTLKRIRQGLNILSIILTSVGVLLIIVAAFTQVWIKQREPDFDDLTVVASPAARRGELHTVGLISDCLVSDLYNVPNLCETKVHLELTAAPTAIDQQESVIDRTLSAGNRVNIGSLFTNVFKNDRWRRQTLFLIVGALICAVECLQLSFCSLALKFVAIFWTICNLVTSLLILSALIVFRNAVSTQYDVDSFGSDRYLLSATTTSVRGEKYTIGYSFLCAVWACGLFFFITLLSLVSTVLYFIEAYRVKRTNFQNSFPLNLGMFHEPVTTLRRHSNTAEFVGNGGNRDVEYNVIH